MNTLLLLITIFLLVYLAFAMFYPEKF
ncbi:K(+)-transporting ATPase subunit F [Alkalimonas cellulosilytica]